MPAESIKLRTNALPSEQAREDLRILHQAQYDALVAAFTSLSASFLILTAKLDLDATVTDTNYAALANPSPTLVATIATKITA